MEQPIWSDSEQDYEEPWDDLAIVRVGSANTDVYTRCLMYLLVGGCCCRRLKRHSQINAREVPHLGRQLAGSTRHRRGRTAKKLREASPLRRKTMLKNSISMTLLQQDKECMDSRVLRLMEDMHLD
ncbi:hypothetical protein PHMEG_00016260 [Phytophthora megakarya]|uniref:Uncharacterized protein n=1 Tax=Phytophthora megakarya TaxID=4795 RepID=A0A225W1B9_9STRA|nr:hypothetical protein PHMEG_00016260 [Phytophthora megakarya]